MSVILTIIKKEIADFTSNVYGVGALILFLILTYGFLWILPVSSYESYGVATSDLYFQFVSYFFLLIVPLLTIGNIGREFKFGTFELLRSRGVSWFQIIIAKFITVILVVIVSLILSSVHLYVVNDLAINYNLNGSKIIGSYMGLILVCAIYTSTAIAVSAIFKQSTIAILLSITISFILYSGVSFVSEADLWSQNQSYVLDSLSLEHQVGLISRGVLKFSSVIYMVSIAIVMMSIANLFFKKIEQ